MRFARAIVLLLGPLMLMGCMYHKITNLTPGALPRNSSGFIPWKSYGTLINALFDMRLSSRK